MTYAGGGERGMALMEKAMALSPVRPGWWYYPTSFYHYRSGDYERALAEAQKVNLPGLWFTPAWLAAAYGQLGRRPQGEAEIEKLLELFPDFVTNGADALRIWFVNENAVAHYMDGLRKAGLDIPGESTAAD